ncbi:MAG: hypothetical protein QOE78_3023 [Alphaproteobacteria bacterium]|jgi:hypothetical protein|nr:hypothetical protein [Alphaproteobacteria bacterium]
MATWADGLIPARAVQIGTKPVNAMASEEEAAGTIGPEL